MHWNVLVVNFKMATLLSLTSFTERKLMYGRWMLTNKNWLWQWIEWKQKKNLGFPCGSAGKESAHDSGDLGSIPGLGRSPGEGKGYPLQYSGLEKSMDCIAWTLKSMWSQRVRHNWANFTFTSLSKEKIYCWIYTPMQWTWVWVCSRHWWWTGKTGMLQSMGSQRVGHDWVTELKCIQKGVITVAEHGIQLDKDSNEGTS